MLGVALLAAVATCAFVVMGRSARAASAAPTVNTFPIPSSQVASPGTQIAFRGLPASQLGPITVVGSKSGAHTGTVYADSDGGGGSFVPAQPFTPGEVVTVTTSLNIAGGAGGVFQFRVATPARGFGPTHWPAAARATGDVWTFRSRPDLAPPAVAITKHARTAPGDIFLAPQFGPVQDGLEILDPNGHLVWFRPFGGDTSAADFRVQSYQGQPVLTWWQGYVTAGAGFGTDVIYDTSYRQIAAVNAANGLQADLHEFQLTSGGTALITAYYPVIWDSSSVHASRREVVLDGVVQEIDIRSCTVDPTCLVLFQWDSLDHVPVGDSYEALPPKGTRFPFDYFHVNSVQQDFDGNLVISARNTWAAYKVNHQTGGVMWRLGGKHSSFRLAPGVYWAFQHDVRVRAGNDMFVTLFDDEAGPPTIRAPSRAIKLFLDTRHMTARQVTSHVHSPSLLANFEGNLQQLPDRDDFVGWGQQPYFSEYGRRGKLVFDGHFVDFTASYRAYRFPWSGNPDPILFPPSAAGVKKGSSTVVYASWDGATAVAAWRVFGGSGPTALHWAGIARKGGFETAIPVRGRDAYVAVEALDAKGRVLAQSPTARTS